MATDDGLPLAYASFILLATFIPGSRPALYANTVYDSLAR